MDPMTTMPFLTLASDAAAAMPVGGSCYTLLVPLLTILSAVLCTLCAIFKVKSKLPAWITVACLAASFGVILKTYLGFDGGPFIAHGFEWINFSLPSLTGKGEAMHFVANFSFYIDNLTLLWMLFVTGLATLIALYASEYMSHDVGAGYCRFFFAFSLFVLNSVSAIPQ